MQVHKTYRVGSQVVIVVFQKESSCRKKNDQLREDVEIEKERMHKSEVFS